MGDSAKPGRKKARDFVAIRDFGTMACRGEVSDGSLVSVPNMTVSDMLRAIKLAEPRVNGRTVARTPGFQVTLRNVLIGTAEIPEEWFAAIPNEPAPKRVEELTREVPAPAPKRATGDDASALIDALNRVVGGSVDVDQVREIVREELKDVRPVTVIEVKDRPTVEIEGRAHAVLPKVIDILSQGMPVYLAGEPGTGKSTIAEHAAEAFGLELYQIQCNAQMSKADLLGYRDATREYATTEFRLAYEFGGVFLFDEMDNGNPNVITTLNQAVANGVCSFPDKRVKMHPDFKLIAAANTWGTGATADFVGRMKLDKATLDRFVRLKVDRDDELESDLVHAILGDKGEAARWLKMVHTVRDNIERNGLKVFCTMRVAIHGAKLLRIGWQPRDIFFSKVTAELSDEQAEKVLAGIPF